MRTAHFTTNRQIVVHAGFEDTPGLLLAFAEDDAFVGIEVNCEGGERFAISREAARQVVQALVNELFPGETFTSQEPS